MKYWIVTEPPEHKLRTFNRKKYETKEAAELAAKQIGGFVFEVEELDL